MQKKPELLAPVGDFDCLKAAVNAGADAVYLAGEKYGARAYAKNFSKEELLEAIKYAHLFDVAVYLTVNTLIKERELEDFKEFLSPFYMAGLDGVIIQDLGVTNLIKNNFSKIKLHASTQMTVTDAVGANVLHEFGFSRVIPARELNLEQIENMVKASSAEVEVFIHGAMCYSYSGQCLFSSMLGERSANRGRCAAPCRKEYSYKNTKDKYMLSLKDMMTIDYLEDLCEVGVSSLKIEGRMKSPEYVAGIVSVYRKYIDKIYENENGKVNISKDDRDILSSIYIRSNPGCGYLNQDTGDNMISLDSPAYTESSKEIISKINKLYIEKDRKIPVDIYAEFIEENPCFISISTSSENVTVTGEVVQRAEKLPATENMLKESLTKLGNTVFKAENVNVTLKGDIFMPKSQLNELRRKGIEALEKEILHRYKNR